MSNEINIQALLDRLRAVSETGCDPDLPHEAANALVAMQAERNALAAKLVELEGQKAVAIVETAGPSGGCIAWRDAGRLEVGSNLFARPAPATPVNVRLLGALRECRDRFFPADQTERDRDLQWDAVNGAIAAAESSPKAVRLTDNELVSAACDADNSFRAIETAVLAKNGIEVAE